MSLFLSGSNLKLFDNGKQVASAPLSKTTAVSITGANNEDDSLAIDFSKGGFFSISGAITFAAGTDANDSLAIIGDGSVSGSYSPSSTTAGAGTFLVGPTTTKDTINMTGVEATSVSSLSAFSVTTGSSADVLTVDSLAANQNRISGTSGGVTVAPVTYSPATNV